MTITATPELEEFAMRGRDWWEKTLRTKLEAGNEGKALIIDIESGDYEMDADSLAATHRLLARKPDAPLFGMRIGYPAMSKRGGSWNRSRQAAIEKP